jgi:hypothetical protein
MLTSPPSPGSLQSSPLNTPQARPNTASSLPVGRASGASDPTRGGFIGFENRPATAQGVSSQALKRSSRGSASGKLEGSILSREPDFFDMRAEPLNERRRQGAADHYTERQVNAAKYIVQASRRRGRRQERQVSNASGSPIAPFGPAHTPKGPVWADQLQQELVATADSMRAAQIQLSQERNLRMMALKNEERAQLEARLARRKAVETTKEQQEAERKMLISANGMRAQREQLQGELSRLAEQQHKLETELQAQRDRASHAEREAERAMEEARIALEQKEHEMELRVQTMEEQRLEQQRKARAMAHELEEEKRQMSDTLAQEKEKRIEHTKEMAIRRFAKRELSKGWVAWKDAHQERLRSQNAMSTR